MNREIAAAYARVVGSARWLSQAADATEIGDDGPVSFDVPRGEMEALRRALDAFDATFRKWDAVRYGPARSRG
jgi:hypothetical protein